MKAALEHIQIKDTHNSFVCYWNIDQEYEFHWHYHPEYELTYIKKSRGLRLVGDHTEEYTDGDLVLLGPNLPHTWASEGNLEGTASQNEALVVQFTADLFPENLPELKLIRALLDRSRRGIHFQSPKAAGIGQSLAEMESLSGLQKLTRFYHILEDLAAIDEYSYIASVLYEPVLSQKNEERLDKVCQYMHQYFEQDIPLEKIARIASMTTTSFCRFFKKMTGQTFTEYLNELRIGRACQLLIESRKNVSEIAFASGFNSSTHFNRVFLKLKQVSPNEYRKRFK